MLRAAKAMHGKVPALLLAAALLVGALVPAHAQGCSQTGQLCTGPPLSNTEGSGMGVCSCPAIISGNACDCLVRCGRVESQEHTGQPWPVPLVPPSRS